MSTIIIRYKQLHRKMLEKGALYAKTTKRNSGELGLSGLKISGTHTISLHFLQIVFDCVQIGVGTCLHYLFV